MSDLYSYRSLEAVDQSMTNRAGLYERKSTGPKDSAASRFVEQQNQLNLEA